MSHTPLFETASPTLLSVQPRLHASQPKGSRLKFPNTVTACRQAFLNTGGLLDDALKVIGVCPPAERLTDCNRKLPRPHLERLGKRPLRCVALGHVRSSGEGAVERLRRLFDGVAGEALTDKSRENAADIAG